ncbi:MAG: hypothetical protein C6W57_06380 [Caldibacillus debilis]|nr:MAG: hypothetical protein C6W57_06380 [Caldibacillus debilis]
MAQTFGRKLAVQRPSGLFRLLKGKGLSRGGSRGNRRLSRRQRGHGSGKAFPAGRKITYNKTGKGKIEKKRHFLEVEENR